jgi:hypothetical protein
MIGLSMRPLLSAGRSPSTESGMFDARNFISDNPNLNYSVKRDLELMGRAAVSISHCPINIAGRARTMNAEISRGWR